MSRIVLFFLVFNFSVLYLSAQSSFSNLEFVENKGQWDTTIKFRAQMTAGSFFLRNGGYSVVLHDTADMGRIHDLLHGEKVTGSGTSPRAVVANNVPGKGHAPGDGGGSGGGHNLNYHLHSHLYNVNFENANPHPEVVAEKPLASYNNYIVGDPRKWASGAKPYLSVTFKNVYDGIDVHYYTNAGVLKYDIIVHPGADPSRISLQYVGADQLSIKKGQLLVKTSASTATELEPRSYQVDNNGRTDVACSYVVKGNRVSFKIKDRSPDATLVIDPTEIFCTFTGSRSDNWGYTSTYDGSGNFYAGGVVIAYPDHSGDLYGATPGAFQSTFQGGDGSEGVAEYDQNGRPVLYYNFDVGIMKFNANGTQIVYATYLGGGGDEQPHSMIVDGQGNLVITGRTTSGANNTTNFPTIPANIGTHQGSGFDLFITKLNATGTFPIGSQRIGGSGDDGVNYSPKYVTTDGTQELRLNYGDDGRGEVVLDAAGNIFVVSCTKSTNFPVIGAFQGGTGGGQDGVVLKFSANAQTLLASSYLGGRGSDAVFSVAVNPLDNNIYVSGGTMSDNLPGVSGSVIAGTNQGGVDGFVSIIRDNGGSLSLLKTTYFGTGATDMIYGLQFDKHGFPYITGTTNSVITPVNSPFNQGGNQAAGKQFITKLRADLSGIVYSANFGPSAQYPNLSPTAFLVDRCENVYVSGWGGGLNRSEHYLNSGTNGLTATAGAIKSSTDGDDFYFFVLQKNAAGQLYGSFFGQNGGLGDHVDGGTSRFDDQGVIYQSICANCGGPANIFPVTAGVVAPRNGALGINGGCNEAAVKIAFNFAGIAAALKVSLDGRGDSLGCVPLTVTLQDTIHRAKSYIWNFGDGGGDSAATASTVTHTYTAVGVYRVMLVAIDSNSCNVADTSYANITVKDNRAILNFDYVKTGLCTDLQFDFHNLSTAPAPAPPFGSGGFAWIFGDKPNVVVPGGGVTTVTPYTFPSPGTYNVSLILTDTNYCNAPDTLTKSLFIATNVEAHIGTPATGCTPYFAHFENNSVGGQTYLWNFGDGTTSTDRVPPDHYYPNPGQYVIQLTVTDPATCNKVSTTTDTITLLAKPSGDFNWSPDPPTPNTPTIFTPVNSSPDAVKWEWLFGDGGSAVKQSPDTVMHQYQRTDTFQACLVVFNLAGCSDTICHPVAALINPLLDVPNAFTPGRFGQNGIVKVMGFGIAHMTFRIYNRWGQMVFQSNDPNIGWDGYYKGTMQPMDVYAYSLEAEFFDGSKVSRKGDITLIR